MSTLKIAKATKGHASSSQLYQNKEKFVKLFRTSLGSYTNQELNAI